MRRDFWFCVLDPGLKWLTQISSSRNHSSISNHTWMNNRQKPKYQKIKIEIHRNIQQEEKPITKRKKRTDRTRNRESNREKKMRGIRAYRDWRISGVNRRGRPEVVEQNSLSVDSFLHFLCDSKPGLRRRRENVEEQHLIRFIGTFGTFGGWSERDGAWRVFGKKERQKRWRTRVRQPRPPYPNGHLYHPFLLTP